MSYYWTITYTNDLPPDLSFADGDDIDGLDAYMGKASCATEAADSTSTHAMRTEKRSARPTSATLGLSPTSTLNRS